MRPPSEIRSGGGVQDLATYPKRPLPFCVAGDAVVKTEPAERGSGIPRRTIRRCRMGVVHVERNQPVHAPETADELTASAVAAPFGPGSAVPGGLAQMFIPPLHTLVIPPPPRLLAPAGSG